MTKTVRAYSDVASDVARDVAKAVSAYSEVEVREVEVLATVSK